MDLIFREKRRWEKKLGLFEKKNSRIFGKIRQAVESEELDFSQWNLKHPEGIKEIAKRISKIGHRDNGIFSNVCTTKKKNV